MKRIVLVVSGVLLGGLLLVTAPSRTAQPESLQVIICHIPPGNPMNMHTISVPEAAIPAHLGHGDTLRSVPDHLH